MKKPMGPMSGNNNAAANLKEYLSAIKEKEDRKRRNATSVGYSKEQMPSPMATNANHCVEPSRKPAKESYKVPHSLPQQNSFEKDKEVVSSN